MAGTEKQNNLGEALKPFYDRASEAEDRLSRLEAALAREKSSASEEHLKKINELESELNNTKSELSLEREKAKKLALENAKLQYRMEHLLRAVKEGDHKLEGK